MARYDYECIKCDKVVEVEKPMAESDRPETCGGCGDELKRMPPSMTNFVLKGSGWYKTDYPKG